MVKMKTKSDFQKSTLPAAARKRAREKAEGKRPGLQVGSEAKKRRPELQSTLPKIQRKGKIQKGELLRILDKLRIGLSTGGGADHPFLFMGDKVAIYNEKVCVAVSLPAVFFSCSVMADEFYKLVSGATGDIQLRKETDGQKHNQIVAEVGPNFSFGLPYEEPGDIHGMVESLGHNDLQWRPLTEEMKRAIVLCSFCASGDMTKPALSGVYVGGGEVLSSDNYRISWHRLEKGIRRKFLVPATSVIPLVNFELDNYALTDSWVHFKGADVIFSACLLFHEYPDGEVKGFFPEKPGKEFEIPKKLSGVLDKTLVLLQEDHVIDKRVTLTFNKDNVVCSVEKPDLGWFKESIPMEGPKNSIKVEANPVFLKEILKYSTKAFVKNNLMVFRSGNFKHLMALH